MLHTLNEENALFLLTKEQDYEFLKYKYGKTDPNDILEQLIKESDRTGDPVDLDGWGYLVMYMPEKLAEKYMREE